MLFPISQDRSVEIVNRLQRCQNKCRGLIRGGGSEFYLHQSVQILVRQMKSLLQIAQTVLRPTKPPIP